MKTTHIYCLIFISFFGTIHANSLNEQDNSVTPSETSPPQTINVTIRSHGRTGLAVPNHSSGSSSSSRGWSDLHFPITWEDAYSQSVKRVFVRDNSSSQSGRTVYKLQRIVPSQTTPKVRATTTSDPPPHEQVAKMARYIVHNSNWTSMATISTRTPIVGFPFANVFSISDGSFRKESSGIAYMYMTPLDMSAQDLKRNSKCSLTCSLAQSHYCFEHKFDPEDPRCAHVILTGNLVRLKNSTQEATFAETALFSRHPEMASWPADHGWFFAKLEMRSILVLDYFGGAKSVTLNDYFAADPL